LSKYTREMDRAHPGPLCQPEQSYAFPKPLFHFGDGSNKPAWRMHSAPLIHHLGDRLDREALPLLLGGGVAKARQSQLQYRELHSRQPRSILGKGALIEIEACQPGGTEGDIQAEHTAWPQVCRMRLRRGMVEDTRGPLHRRSL